MATFTHQDATLGNLLSSQSLGVSTSVSATLDLRLNLSATIRVDITYGSVTAGTYTTVSWFSMVDGTTAPTAYSVPDGQFSITPTASQMVTKNIPLPGGEKYTITVLNGDGTNSVTVRLSNDLVTGIA